jgi:hypothetical protein
MEQLLTGFAQFQVTQLQTTGALAPVSAERFPIQPASAEAPASQTTYSNVFLRTGETWTVGYGGKSTSLRNAKGLRYIAQLLASPRKEFLALDLQRAVDGGAGSTFPVRVTAAQLEDDGLEVAPLQRDRTVTDRRARTVYEDGLKTARRQLEQALQNGDERKAAELRQTVHGLEKTISSDFGLGGRARNNDAAEKARKTVCKCVAESIRKLYHHHPELARHLENSIRQGTYLSYSPEQSIEWEAEAGN